MILWRAGESDSCAERTRPAGPVPRQSRPLRCGVRVVVVFNPHSGAGRAQHLAHFYAHRLSHEGFGVDLCCSHGPASPHTTAFASVAASLTSDDAVLVAGGDGTIHRILPSLLDSGAALCQLPAGTENLFAREFGSPSSPESVASAILNRRRRHADVGNLAGTPFALMASTGPDASIIRRLDARRSGPITHLDYITPILHEFLNPSLPLLSVEADGLPWISHRRGMLILANSRHYAWRLNPCRSASCSDGQLDAVFLAGDSSPDMVRWAVAHLCTYPEHSPADSLTTQASAFRVTNHSLDVHAAWQADGELVTNPQIWNGQAMNVYTDSRKLSTLICS